MVITDSVFDTGVAESLTNWTGLYLGRGHRGTRPKGLVILCADASHGTEVSPTMEMTGDMNWMNRMMRLISKPRLPVMSIEVKRRCSTRRCNTERRNNDTGQRESYVWVGTLTGIREPHDVRGEL